MSSKQKLPKIFLFLGLGFLYLPIFVILIYSFNAASFVHLWGGGSFRWYAKLFDDVFLWNAAWISIKIAITSATLATFLGTLSALALTRFSPFRGGNFFSTLTTAPLVMPEIITGLSLLLLFVFSAAWLDWPTKRGFWTICIGHTTLAMAYVVTIVRARLSDFDMSLEEAALDLGAKPHKVLWQVTLPVISPALMTGWLLAFMLSFDDVIIASFVTGPGATTLPMVIFSRIRTGVSPEINALAALFIGFVSMGVFAVGWKQLRKSKT